MENNHVIYWSANCVTGYSGSELNVQKESTRTDILKRTAIAREYIIKNYNKKFSLKDVAYASFFFVNHLLRTFKAVYGISPYKFLSNVRP